MNYVVWVKKCKNDDRSLASRLWDKAIVDLVRFVAWSGEGIVPAERFVCACDECAHQLSLVLLRCNERMLETALNADPVLIERVRHSIDGDNGVGYGNFVHYSFAHPSSIDSRTLLNVLALTDASLLYVTTAYDTTKGVEDTSVFKINLVRRETPGCENHAEWLAARISALTHCESQRFETRYVSYLTLYTGDGHSFESPAEIGVDRTTCYIADRAAAVPTAVDSLRALRRRRTTNES